MASAARRGRPTVNPSAIYCQWAQGVIAFFLITFGWAVFTEIVDLRSKTLDQPFQSLPEKDSTNEHDHNVSRDYSINTLCTVDCSFIESVLESANEQLNRIRKDWQIGSYPKFLNMMHVPELSWDLQKAKFMQLLIENSLTSTLRMRTYVAGFSGSSITAGHGRRNNFFYEAFPQVFHNRLLSTFTAMRMKLDTRNHAIGNNPCFPYDACISTHLGDDLDLLTWEQSMNCGRDSRPVDTFTRNSLRTGRMTVVVYMLSGGPTWSLADCANITSSTHSTFIPSTNESNIPLRTHAGTSQLMSSMEFLTDHHSSNGPNKLYERYSAASPMALSTFPIAEYRCHGPYDSNFSARSTGSAGASWHPGRKGHQLRGDALAYFILQIIADAARSIQELACTTKAENIRKNAVEDPVATSDGDRNSNSSVKSEQFLRNDTNKLSDGATRNKTTRALRRLSTTHSHNTKNERDQEDLLHNITATLSSSLTNFHSAVDLKALKLKLSSISSKHSNNRFDLPAVYLHSVCTSYLNHYRHQPLPPVPSHYDIPETNYEPLCYTDYQPRQKQNMSITSLIHPPKGKWTRELSWFDKAAVEKAERKKFGYLDRKYIYRSNSNGTSFSLHINMKHSGSLWLCELQKGFQQYPSTMADLNDGADIFIRINFPFSTEATNVSSVSSKPSAVTAAKRLEIKHFVDQCYRTVAVPPGEHLLTITQKAGKQINLAYVVAW